MLVKLYGENPSERELQRIVGALEHDELIVYPTDSVYAVGCSLRAPRAIERLRRMKGDGELTVVCESIAQVSEYCRVDNAVFRILKRNLPGPFTFCFRPHRTSPTSTGKAADNRYPHSGKCRHTCDCRCIGMSDVDDFGQGRRNRIYD